MRLTRALAAFVIVTALILALGTLTKATAYVDPETRLAGSTAVFSVLKKTGVVAASTTADLVAADIVGAEGTIPLPYRIRIQNIGTFNVYRGAVGGPTPTATSPVLIPLATAPTAIWDEVFYKTPNYKIRSVGGAVNLAYEVWTKE